MADTPTSTPLTVPSRTTPTWEVELLISGALVISLFQLIDPMELTFAKWIALAPANRTPMVIYSYMYSKLALFALIGTFVLHVAARAAWVALVGVHSIYPDGPRWENLSGGALTKKVVRKMCGDIAEAIERADNRATLIFGYGMLAAQFAVVVLILTLAAITLGFLLEPLVGEHWALLSGVALMTLPITLFGGIDWLFGKRLREGGWWARQLERGLRLSILLNLGRLTQPLLPLVTTNIGGRRGNWLLALVFGLIMSAVVLDTQGRTDGGFLLRGSALPAQARSSGVNSLHYAALRSEMQRFAAAPYIPSELIEGPYLRLFVPYAADRHDQALQIHCAQAVTDARLSAAAPAAIDADLVALEQTRQRSEAALMACFAGLLDLRLDGVALPQVVLERHRDPFSGHDGGLAMIDVRALPPGRHEVQIKQLPRAPNSIRFQSGPLPAPDRIVFWR